MGGSGAGGIAPPVPCAAQIRRLRTTVYSFYRRHGRHDLPWRLTTDPYHVYVSEVMLQQTQVDRVRERYPRFIETFPDWSSLAGASLEQVLAQWQGLGYNRRGRNLWLAARMVMQEFNGTLPDVPVQLQRLPGIGPATAASIAAFAFHKPVVFIETNIRSVYLHHFFPGEQRVPDTAIIGIAARCLDKKNPYAWYSALMDYGTSLKRHTGNPSRRSRHHSRQKAFAGSDRQVRGAILRVLLGHPGQSIRAIAASIGEPRERTESILERLCREGMVSAARGRFCAGGTQAAH